MALLGKKSQKEKKFPMKKDTRDMHCRVLTDLFQEDDAVQSWRIFRIMTEFVSGFDLLRRYSTAATFFGSARFSPQHPMYRSAELLASKLAKDGFAVITGGGPGIMEAANVGAFKVGGASVGLNIQLPIEQKLNPYVTESESFHYFFSRRVMLAFASEVYIFFPGGFGTLDEFFEMLTLIQTRKITNVPIVLYGREFWTPLLQFLEQQLLLTHETIDKVDLSIYHVVDSVDEAYEYVMEHVDPTQPRQI